MNTLDAATLSAMIQAAAARIAAQRDALNTLDSALGDGDHGTGISTAFTAAAEAIAALEAPAPADLLRVTGNTLMNRMGGASGAIFGTLFMRAAISAKDKPLLQQADVHAMLQAGLEGVMQRGKAQPGDKTMIDALAPALAAFAAAPDFDSAWQQAAEAAASGAEATLQMQARHGRARFTAERSIGQKDAGAQSVALMFAAFTDTWKEHKA